MQTDSYVVHVVDDEEPVRKSLAFLLTMAGFTVRVHESAVSFLDSVSTIGRACLITDLRMPDMSGVELLERLREKGASVPAIVITGHGDVPMAVSAMKAGAVEFLTKPFRDQDMLDAVQVGHQRDRRRRDMEQSTSKVRSTYETLTPREKEILALVTAGLMNKQIAGAIGVSEITVKVHRGSVMRKMGAKSLADLVRMADSLGVHRTTTP